jgi:hypothetical protein
MYLSSDHRIRRERPGAAPSASLRCGFYRYLGRHAAVVEERGRRVGLEDALSKGAPFGVGFERSPHPYGKEHPRWVV